MGVVSYVKEEIQVIRERDPAIKSNMEVFLYPSFKVILNYRIAHKLYLKKHFFWARWISQRAARKTGIEIHPGATIGKGLFIDHGSGVIIGETTIIGDNVTLYQGVTLGGTGKEQGKRHPTLKDNVMVFDNDKTIINILGCSFNKIDVPYFVRVNEDFPKAKWNISFYDNDDKKRIKNFLKKYGIRNYNLYRL